MVNSLREVGHKDINENSVLLGPPAHIADVLKKMKAAWIDEVILLLNNEHLKPLRR